RPYLGGQSEQAVKTCLSSRYPRSSFLLANKLSASCFQSREDIRPLVRRQLDACGVDYFDCYLMHAQDAKRFERYRELQAYETAFRLREEGVLRHVGLSFHDRAEVLERILTAYPELEFVQIQFNYLDYDDAVVQSRACYDVCRAFGKPMCVMEPVKGGRLANLSEAEKKELDRLGNRFSPAGYALRFALDFEGVEMVLSGMSSLEQMEDNLRTMSSAGPLSPSEKDALENVRRLMQGEGQIPCTSCRYCVEGCPAGIPIPDLFSCWNSNLRGNGWTSRKRYADLTEGGGRASDCLRCGGCEDACPQHLPVRDHLQAVAGVFDAERP
ncbi:MAG: aldo/keto reductase, partial [Clostridia bacterium]|nr:aldo/keto reductase [Clostridia bacterium]